MKPVRLWQPWLLWLLNASLLYSPASAQDDALIDLLNNRSYDRDSLIRELEPLSVTVSPPAAGTQQPDTNIGNQSQPRPLFAPPQAELPPGQATRASLNRLALVLPFNTSGSTATIADIFRRGCINGLNALNASLQLDIYAHDGSTAQALSAYESAVAADHEFIIGPMQKNNVRALRQRYPQASVKTLLLQPAAAGGADGGGYYVLTIDIGEEAAELARLISRQTTRVMIVSDNSPISQRQRAAFSKAWALTTASEPEQVYIYDPAKDWQKLFNRLKKQIEQAEKDEALQALPPLIIFAAGNGDFTRRTRNFVPQKYPIYASSIFFSGSDDMNFLDNLYLMEMPWFVAPESVSDNTAAEAQIRIRPALQQRFYALGLDACRAAAQSQSWFDGWQMNGASGRLQLAADTFRRRGVLSRYENGALNTLPQ